MKRATHGQHHAFARRCTGTRVSVQERGAIVQALIKISGFVRSLEARQKVEKTLLSLESGDQRVVIL